MLSIARRKAGLSQRELARRAGVPQSTIGRIEAGLMDPRIATLDRLLRACGYEIRIAPRLGEGVDRTLIRSALARTPKQRIEANVASAGAVRRLRGKAQRTP